MNINELNEFKKLTKKIELCTLGDLHLFQKLQNCNGWNLITALKNYSRELED